jgi:hypothetical protein
VIRTSPLARRLLALGLLAAGPARASEPCALAPGTDHAVAIRLTAPHGTLVAGVTLVVDHPEDAVGLAGEGIAVPASVITDAPTNAVASANDLGDAVRVVIARPDALPLDGPLLRLHFQRCQGAKAPDVARFTCTVTDAADPSTNPVQGVGCVVAAP